jgi:hypothetical protein
VGSFLVCFLFRMLRPLILLMGGIGAVAIFVANWICTLMLPSAANLAIVSGVGLAVSSSTMVHMS